MIIFLRVFTLFLILAGCRSAQVESYRTLLENPIRNIDNYGVDFSRPWQERVGTPVPEFYLEKLRQFDGNPSYQTYVPTAEQKRRLFSVMESFPLRDRDGLSARLIGIFFVENLGGAGLCDFALDENGTVYVLMAINPEVFRVSLDDWLTARESSAFLTGKYSLRVETGLQLSALEYVILHEGAHAADYLEGRTPEVLSGFGRFFGRPESLSTEFTRGVWISYHRVDPAYDFPERQNLRFYDLKRGTRIKNRDMVPLYKGLSKTPFVSAYASVNWAEDWAETVVAAHVTEIAGASWKIHVLENGAELFAFEAFSSPESQKRRALVRELIDPASDPGVLSSDRLENSRPGH